MTNTLYTIPHRRFNPLIGEWLLLSPHRTKRPWQGKNEDLSQTHLPKYDKTCFLCPGNVRANGVFNEKYSGTYVFENDFSALLPQIHQSAKEDTPLFKSKSVTGLCRAICFSDRHDLTLAQMSIESITDVIQVWMDQHRMLRKRYPWIQIFENKGQIMGCSNPHPHGQIWASDFIPQEPKAEDQNQREYFNNNKKVLLLDYLEKELRFQERIIIENETWVALVPYWAVWPFEVMILPKAHTLQISDLDKPQQKGLALIMKELLVKYDNIFETSFPYSMGWHGEPHTAEDSDHWQLHAHFYPPLLRSATIKKFMVGYEMLGCAQRDITPETAAEILRDQSTIHYQLSEG